MENYNKDDSVQQPQQSLTKHLKELKAFPPLYTGGSFVMHKDE
jgi:hypothetical protein